MALLGFLPNLGFLEIIVIGSLAVMLYGKRLPEVGRTFGRTIGDLRRQWQTLARELEVAANAESTTERSRRPVSTRIARDEEAGARLVESPRFEPPEG